MDGWKCPSCGSCYAPSVAECFKCNAAADARNTITTNTITIPMPKDQKADESQELQVLNS